MKIMLTSFGIEQTILAGEEHKSMFYRMPPVSFREIQKSFMPDYDLLLLCDKLVMDKSSFENLSEEPTAAYSQVAETLTLLNQEGRIELVDYGHLLKSNADLLNRMIESDIHIIDRWIQPLRESLTLWRHFADKSVSALRDRDESWLAQRHFHDVRREVYLHSLYHHAVDHRLHETAEVQHITMIVDEALQSSSKRKGREHRDALRHVLRSYLGYVNANLILSNHLNVGFHDWHDFTPFYTTKFLSVGKNTPTLGEERTEVERLFTIPFPELAIRDSRSLLRVLNDKRVSELRQLIGDAVEGKVQFDIQFAKSVLQEVFQIERRARKWRNIFGYLTMPIGFIPWVGSLAEKAVGEVINTKIENNLKQQHKWFYMLSEIAEDTEKRTAEDE